MSNNTENKKKSNNFLRNFIIIVFVIGFVLWVKQKVNNSETITITDTSEPNKIESNTEQVIKSHPDCADCVDVDSVTYKENVKLMEEEMAEYEKQTLSTTNNSERSSSNSNSKSEEKSSSSNSNSLSTSNEHSFIVTITWNNANCSKCPYPRPSAQNGIIDYFYEPSGSYLVKPKCPICGKTQNNTIQGFTNNIGTRDQGSKVEKIRCIQN
jgi:hypothetical protein